MKQMTTDSHKLLQTFADQTVNLGRERARVYRQQVHRLRENLGGFIAKNPNFGLRKMLLSGSLAKHTALSTINDADVAVYIVSAPEDVGDMVRWLARKLRHAFPNFNADQVTLQDHSVKINFRGTGLDVDVVPVYQTHRDHGDWGHVVSRTDGSKVRTNITLHKEFITARRAKYDDYHQVVRLLKWWAMTRKAENREFKFKSFMIELVLAKLVDSKKLLPANYPQAMSEFFDYICETNFGEMIYFSDFLGAPGGCASPIRVFDPVNRDNNVAAKYTARDRDIIVSEAMDAGDAIVAALRAPSKGQTSHYWRKVFGTSFSH